ncbi:MAG: DUF1993 family protein [Pseudobdellovibrionaceae bacterium]
MLYELTAVQFSKMLKNLQVVLDKGAKQADHKKFDMLVLLNSRLAPDQFPLIRQIQIACDSAKLCVSRLTDKEPPAHDDKETTYAELKTRIDQVVSYLNSLSASDFSKSAEKRISQPRWEGKSLSGTEFVIQHATPNVYFHITTAYAILRHNGVDVGKKDYLGEMPYRPASSN